MSGILDSEPAWSARLEDNDDFVFIGTVLDVQLDLPRQVGPSSVLSRATDDEVSFVKDYLDKLVWTDSWANPYDAYEQNYHEENESIKIEYLPRESWRYYVIRCQDDHDVDLLRLVAPLTASDLRLGPSWPPWRGPSRVPLDADYFTARGWRSDSPTLFRTQDADELAMYAAQYSAALTAFPALEHALEMFGRIPIHSDLSVLGLFVVLECVLTHNPKGSTDKLGHQVQSKMALLSNRFANPLDYSQFGGAAIEEVWRMMYRYRSIVAHGGKPDFRHDLKMLDHEQSANRFLREAARRVLGQAVCEPILIRDLQRC